MLFLAICASVFAVAQLTDPENVRFLALDSAVFPERWYAVVTTGFVHVELNHIIVNMLLLLWVGTWVERSIGSRRFAVLVFVAILAGSLSILVRDTAGIGFSAAAAAIVFDYHVAFPFERELPLRIPNIVLPVVLFVGSLAAATFGWFPEVGHGHTSRERSSVCYSWRCSAAITGHWRTTNQSPPPPTSERHTAP